MLERIGLDAATTAVYRARLLDPDVTTAELAERLQMSARQVESSTQRLVSRGLAVPMPGQGAVRPVSPEIGLELLISLEEDELRRQEVGLQRLRSEISAFTDDYRRRRERRSATRMEHLDGPGQITTRLAELVSDTREELLCFVSHRPDQESLARYREVDSSLLERGVSIRSVYLASALNEPLVQEYLTWYVGAGGGVRTTPTLPVAMTVHDRECALVAVDPFEPSKGAVVLTSPGSVAALVALFETQWREGESTFSRQRHTSDKPRPAEVELLQLLMAGHTDDSSARHLQVSARTIRRMLTELQRKAGAGSRFELAARAVHLGWLDVE